MRFFLALIAIVALLFAPVWVSGKVPFPGDYLVAWYEPWKSDNASGQALGIPHKPVADDVFRHQYPMKTLAWDMIRRGQLPLWNPYNGAGQPLLAMMHPGFLNPFNIVFLLTSPIRAWTFIVIAQVVVLGLVTYLFARRVGQSTAGATMSSLVLVLSGFAIVRLLYTEFLFVFAGLPALLYFIEDLRGNRQRWQSLIGVPLVVAFMTVSGQPQMIVYVLVTALAYAFFRRWQDSLVKFFALVVLGLLLSAVQLVPTVELFAQAAITSESSRFIFERFLVPPSHLLTVIVPNYFGNQSTYNFWGRADFVETAASVGSVSVLMAVVALWKRKGDRRHVSWFFVWLGLTTVLLTLDWPVTRLLFSLPVPIIATGVPSRIFSLTAFGLSMLAGFGFDVWQKRSLSSKAIRCLMLFGGGALVVVSVASAVLYWQGASCPSQIVRCRLVALRNTMLEAGVFLTCATLIWLSLRKGLVRFLKIIGIGITIAVGVSFLYNAYKFLPFTTSDRVMPRHTLLAQLSQLGFGNRVFGLGQAHIKTDFATHYRFYDPEYFDPLYIRRYGELIAYAGTGHIPKVLPRSDVEIINDAITSAELFFRRERLFDLLSVSHLVYKKADAGVKAFDEIVWEDDTWQIAKRKSALPRVYIVYETEIAIDDAVLARLFDPTFDPGKAVILEKATASHVSLGRTSEPTTARIQSYSENAVTVEVTAQDSGILVLTDTYYPGWRAAVDGIPAEVLRANYTLRGVVVPSGKHEVVFRYQPASFSTGFRITAWATALWVVTLIYMMTRRWYNTRKKFE